MLLAFNELTVGVGVIGFGLGVALGAKVQHYDRNAPFALGVAFSVLFYLIANVLVTIFFVVLIGVVVLLLSRTLPLYRDTLRTFAESAGLRVRRRKRGPTFFERGDAVTSQYEQRAEWLRDLPIHEDYQRQLLDGEEMRYKHAISGLTEQFPYLDEDSSKPQQQRPSDGIANWFDNPKDIES